MLRSADGLDLSAYEHYKQQPVKPPAPTKKTTLSEVELTEARTALYDALTRKPEEVKLPANIHQRLAAAIRGY